MLQSRIKNLIEYFKGIEINNNLIIVRIVYPNNWKAYPNDNINVVRSEDDNTLWYYYADVNDVDIDKIFDLIEETINANKSAEEKIQLLREKVSELKELFSNESLDKLKTLEFTFNSKSKTNKKRKTKKQENEKKIEEVLTIVKETKEEHE